MKKLNLYPYCAAVLVFIFLSCDSESTIDNATSFDSKISDFSDEPATKHVNFNHPVKVVESVFEAARTYNLEILNNLCDPFGENNDGSRKICELSDDEIDIFVHEFSEGMILDNVMIKGDTARVPIRYGINGDKESIITLIKREKKWFILNF